MKRLACIVLVVSCGCAQAVSSSESPETTLLPTSDSPQPSATVAEDNPAPFGVEDLPRIVITEETLSPGMTVDDELTGLDALVQPVALLEESTFAEQLGFVDARMTRVGTSGPGSYWEEGGYVTWVALYQGPGAATTAFEVLVNEHESVTGWGLERVGAPAFGDTGVSLEGPAYGYDARLHIWRSGNLLLAAVALGVTATGEDAADGLLSMAQGMDSRAGQTYKAGDA